MRVLVTGFPPFSGCPVNPSQHLIQLLETLSSPLWGAEIVTAEVPVDYAGLDAITQQLLSDVSPDVWIAFGVGRQETPLRLELRGINRDHSERPDNNGLIRMNSPISANGPETIEVDLPLEELASVLTQAGFTAVTSCDAGTYLCNHLLYSVLEQIQTQKLKCQFMFVHLARPEIGFPVEKLLFALQIMIDWFQNRSAATEEKLV